MSGGEIREERAYFIVAISLRIFSSGNARRGVNGMRITHLSSVSPSSERKTMGKQIITPILRPAEDTA
jgi:hypothetical protein